MFKKITKTKQKLCFRNLFFGKVNQWISKTAKCKFVSTFFYQQNCVYVHYTSHIVHIWSSTNQPTNQPKKKIKTYGLRSHTTTYVHIYSTIKIIWKTHTHTNIHTWSRQWLCENLSSKLLLSTKKTPLVYFCNSFEQVFKHITVAERIFSKNKRRRYSKRHTKLRVFLISRKEKSPSYFTCVNFY